MYKLLKIISLLLLAIGSTNLAARDSIIAHKAAESLLLDIEKLPNGRLVTVGERGHILFSDDKGDNWTQLVVPTTETLTAVSFFNDQLGVAVGYEQTILLTKDGGQTWTVQHYLEESIDSPALFDVIFVNEKRIIAIGAYGLYLESNDGGVKWQAREVTSLADVYEGYSHFYSIVQGSSPNHLLLAGEKYVASTDENGEETNTGLLAQSHNGGRSWTKLNSPYEGSFFGINYDQHKRIYAYGLRGNIYRSANSGATWQSLNVNSTSGLHDLLFSKGNDWLAVGTGGLLIHSKAGKKNIDKRSDLKGRAAIVALDNGEYIIVGEGGIEKFVTQAEQLAPEKE